MFDEIKVWKCSSFCACSWPLLASKCCAKHVLVMLPGSRYANNTLQGVAKLCTSCMGRMMARSNFLPMLLAWQTGAVCFKAYSSCAEESHLQAEYKRLCTLNASSLMSSWKLAPRTSISCLCLQSIVYMIQAHKHCSMPVKFCVMVRHLFKLYGHSRSA
jgi:hypothetical protein